MVRAAEVEVRGETTRILRTGVAPLPTGFWDDPGACRDQLAQAIRTALTTAGIHTRSVVTALPRRFVTIKYARLPQGTPEQVAGMVRFEAQQYVPFPVDEAVLDHQVISESGADMATVMIAAARKSLVNDILAAFDRAGVEVTRVSVTSLALAEHLRDEPVPTAICRKDGTQLDIAVATAGRILFSRSAELLATEEGQTINEALAAEIARSLAAYQAEYRTLPVERLVVVADPSESDGMPETLSSALQISVTVLSPEHGYEPSQDGAGALAAGLALHESSAALSTLNLIPVERLQRKAEARRKIVTRLVALISVAVVVTAVWLGNRALQAQAQERRRAVYENARLKRIQPVASQAQDQFAKMQRMYLTVNYALGRDKPVVDVIKAISDALPRERGLYLTQLTFDRNGPVVLHGNAPNQDSVTQFMTNLQSAGLFSEVRLGYVGDAGATVGPLAKASSEQSANQSIGFMLYCRLPQPPTLEDNKKPTGKKGAAATLQENTP